MAIKQGRLLGIMIGGLQILFIILFSFVTDYNDDAHAVKATNLTKAEAEKWETVYPMFQDVNVMIFVGIGFLLTFLKRHSYSSFGWNFMIGAVVVQWAALFKGFIRMIDPNAELKDNIVPLSIQTLLSGEFAAATVLISFCTVLGQTSPSQLLVFALIEAPMFLVNEWICSNYLKSADIAGSMYIHVFAAYFSLTVAKVIWTPDVPANKHKEGSTYNSDIFALVGTGFLWVYWPSFNACLAEGDAKHRAILNTFYSLTASCLASYAVSSLLHKDGKLDMAHVQNASLAGGVGAGAVADMMITPGGALGLGTIVGAACTLGFWKLTPLMSKYMRLHDSCGVHNLHGIPGIISAIASIIVAATATKERYGESLTVLYPARAYRTASEQALYQFLALLTTIGIAITSGAITGLIMRIPIWNNPKEDMLFEDAPYWKLPDIGYPPDGNLFATKDDGNCNINMGYIVDKDKAKNISEDSTPNIVEKL